MPLRIWGRSWRNPSGPGPGRIAPPGATSLTVPPDMLSNLPATRPNPLQSKDVIYLVNLAGSSLQNLNAKGLDQGASAYFLINGKTVVLQ